MKNRSFKFLPAVHTACMRIGWVAVVLLVLTAPAARSQSGDEGNPKTMIVLPDRDAVACNVDQPCPGETDLRLYTSKTGPNIKRDNVVFIHFGLWSVPAGAVIDEVALSFYLKKQVDPNSEQFVSVYELPRQTGEGLDWNRLPVAPAGLGDAIASAKITSRNIDKATHFVLDGIEPKKWLPAHNGDLWLFLAANSQQYRYHSTRADNPSLRPKLIVKYHMPPYFRFGNWAQYRYNAQHTGQIEWQSNTTTSGFNIKTVFNAGAGSVTNMPVYCNNRLVFYYQSKDEPKNIIEAYSDNGGQVAENRAIGGIVTNGPVAGRNNYIYCVVDYKTLQVLDGGNDLRVLHTKTLNDGAQARGLPVIGFDGSIYINTDKGIYAYTAVPEFKLKWKYTFTPVGNVALSEDERTVYTYDGGDKPGTGRLVALNNINGHERWAIRDLLAFSKDLPMPSVKNDRVCFTDNQANGNNFYIINEDDGAILKKVTGTGNNISQPVMGNNEAFIINNGKIQSYNLSDGAFVKEYASQLSLEAASSLAMDKSRNLYILNTESNTQSLTMVAVDKTTTPVIKLVPKADYGNLTGNCLLVLPNGKLVATSNNFLYAFTPTGFAETNAIKIPFNSTAFTTEYLYRAENKITVSEGSTLSGTKNVVIHAKKGGVGFGKNFKVEKGAQLRVQSEQ